MHAKCLIVEPIINKEENIYCNYVVKLDLVSIVSSTSKGKSVYIPLHRRNHKVERMALKPKPLFGSHPRNLNGSNFVLIYHHCSVIGHIRPQCFMLKREQNHVVRSILKNLMDLNTLFVTIVVLLVI